MKIGILGLGSIGARHAENARMLGHEVIGHDPRYDVGHTRDEAFSADAIVIASPTERHHTDLIDAVYESKPILIEKPLVAAKQNVFNIIKNIKPTAPVCIGFMLRFHPYVQQAKQWIDQGCIGTPLWTSFTIAQKNNKPAYLRDGAINNFASHEIDIALYLLGPGEVVCATAHVTEGNDDMADFVIEHAIGCRTSIHTDYLTDPERRGFTIVGSIGAIETDIARKTLKLTGKICSRQTGAPSFDEIYLEEMRAFIERIETGRDKLADWRAGVAAMEIVLQARKLSGLP